MTSLLWFRRDLRLADNPALTEALRVDPVIPVYIHDPEAGGDWPEGSASRWWLHHSLQALDRSLGKLGSRLIVRRGPALSCLKQLVAETGARRVFWNRRYEPSSLACDSHIEQKLQGLGLSVETFNSALLYEPWQITRAGKLPYKVFTPYWKALQAAGLDQPLLSAPSLMPPVASSIASLPIETLELLPKIPWDGGLREHWQPGESGALARLETFLATTLAEYGTLRDRPDRAGVSRLSPHLHFGEIGPRQIVQAVHASAPFPASAECYLRQLVWREFAHHLLYHFPHTPTQALNERFGDFPWAEVDRVRLAAWQRGETGIPFVDAGMRELWRTGWMHNRVRMVTASLLTKNLRYPWLVGARWFWDTLVDAGLANNTLGWQWVAGCGADAAPYFRIFNPVLQGERFDPEGAYVRHWLPELASLPANWIHRPWLWMASPTMLQKAGVCLGQNYPLPIVDLKHSREHALAAFASLKRFQET